jgi:hypothetical protein
MPGDVDDRVLVPFVVAIAAAGNVERFGHG